MTKPWEEEWKMHTRERDVVVLKGSGKMVLSTGNPLYTGGPEDFARARLASKAPKMARVLLEIRSELAHCRLDPDGANEVIERVLREAGVLE